MVGMANEEPFGAIIKKEDAGLMIRGKTSQGKKKLKTKPKQQQNQEKNTLKYSHSEMRH